MQEYLDKVLEIINSFIKEELTHKEIDEDLLKYGLDSIIFIRIIVSIEENYDVEIPDEYISMSNLDTVNKFATLVSELLNK